MGWTRGQKIDMQNGERVNLSDRLPFVLLTALPRFVTICPVLSMAYVVVVVLISALLVFSGLEQHSFGMAMQRA